MISLLISGWIPTASPLHGPGYSLVSSGAFLFLSLMPLGFQWNQWNKVWYSCPKSDGSGEVNQLAIDHYNDVIDDVIAKGQTLARSNFFHFSVFKPRIADLSCWFRNGHIFNVGLTPIVTLWTQDHPYILDVTYGGPLDRQYMYGGFKVYQWDSWLIS
jgi:hypothetical protein